MIQKQETQVETVIFVLVFESYIVFSRCLVFSEFVFYFSLYFFKFSADHGFWTKQYDTVHAK
jgi:hypothetical protein